MPQIGNQFVNWGQYLALNDDDARRQAQGLQTGLANDASAAMTGIRSAEESTSTGQTIDFSPALRGLANRATDGLNAAAGGTYGLQALLQRQRKGTGYTAGQGLYDAALTGSAAGSAFKGLRGQYRDLFGGMEKAQGRKSAEGTPHATDGLGGGIKDGGATTTDADIERERYWDEIRREQPELFRGRNVGGRTLPNVQQHRGPVKDDFSNWQQWFERFGR